MLLPSALPFLLLSLSLSVLAKDHIITSAPSPTSVIVERDFLSSASPGCSTVSGLAVPQPSGLTCGVPAISNFGGFIIAYSSPSPYVLALAACGSICLATANCTNVYFTKGSGCNLHSGPSTQIPTTGAPFKYYDAGCFKCTTAPKCSTVSGLALPQPSGASCGAHKTSNGGVTISALTNKVYTVNLAACSLICLQTKGCTNVYFQAGIGCNLHSGLSTAVVSANSPWFYYDLSCFTCPAVTTSKATITSSSTKIPSSTSIACSTVSGLAIPQPSGKTCGVRGNSNGTASAYLISYGTGSTYVQSLAACAAICLATASCTNLYFTLGSACNLHYGPDTIQPLSTAQYLFYNVGCFTCGSAIPSSTSIKTTSGASSKPVSQSAWTSVETNPAMYNMALTTTYTQSPQCTSKAITEMAYGGPYLWENSMHPAPTLTITTCYPSQFYSSVMADFSTVPLPAFSALVCPYKWETYNYNATYIVCCPSGFGVAAPNYDSNPIRPFSGALCTSWIGPGELYDITSYDASKYLSIVPATAAATGTVVFADAFDGIMATAAAATTTKV